MFKKVRLFVWRAIAVVNVLAAIAMCVSGYSGYVSPNSYPLISISGLVFPLLLAINLAFIAFWIIFHWRYLLIPVVALLVCYGPVRLYCPINKKKEIPKDCIKVMSYNVHHFGVFQKNKQYLKDILDYIGDNDADIVCLQESIYKKYNKISLKKYLAEVYPYSEVTNRSSNFSSHYIYSKYPILYKEIIDYESEGNMSEAYLLDIDGDTVLLVNNHLETYGLSKEDKHNYAEIVEGNKNNGGGMLVGKIVKATQKRAGQAECVHKYIERFKDMPVIVCGDFNDTPLSYAHHTIAKGLTDTYASAGNGPGYTYTDNNMYERIDHILCSSHFEPCASYVDNKIKDSDHFPIISYIKKRTKR